MEIQIMNVWKQLISNLFNRNMTDLLAGKAVDMPIFNFKTGKKEYKGNASSTGTG